MRTLMVAENVTHVRLGPEPALNLCPTYLLGVDQTPLNLGMMGFTSEAMIKEGPYQDRPPLCPFRLSPLLTCSGSTIAFLKILKIQGPNPKI